MEMKNRMNGQTKQVFAAAFALPEFQRAQLAEQLLETISLDIDELSDDELAAELDRRGMQVRRGKALVVPWSKLRREK
jgi:putative addiction module component (TIGR02574 family)